MIRGAGRVMAAMAALCAGAGSAAAFDALEDMVGRLPASPGGIVASGEWYFIAPALLADMPRTTWPGVGDADLSPSLLDAAVGLETVGIDFTVLDGILNYGTPPNEILYLAGDGITPEAVGTALLQREGMARSELGGFVVFSEREDGTLNLNAIESGYPFGMRGAQAHRVAVTDGAAIVTATTPLLADAVAAFAAEDRRLLAELVEAARATVPPGLAAFGATGMPRRLLFPDRGDTAPFDYVMLIASSGENGEAAQAVLLFPAIAAVELVMAPLVERLQAFHDDTAGKIVWVPVPTSGGAAAIVTLAFPPGTSGQPAAAAYRNWIGSIFRRGDLFLGP
ncbi:MAG: hypothetical protein KIS96_05065 [Bauldia sp.]|nr:hypothetical protein [Bauldia sp.]